MSFKPWSVAVAFLVMFSLVGLSALGAGTGAALAVLIMTALAAPALLLRESAGVTPMTPDSYEKRRQAPRASGAIRPDAAA